MYHTIILNKVLDYLTLKKILPKRTGKTVMSVCPFCKQEPPTGMLIPNTSTFNCIPCKRKFNLLDLVKHYEPDKKDYSDEDIYFYLKKLFNLSVQTITETQEIDKILSFYEEQNFDLVAVAQGGKAPIEKGWPDKTHKTKDEWSQWIVAGLNIGIKTGKKSNVTVIDVDTKELSEELKTLLFQAKLIQETQKGYHFFFVYDEKFPKTRIDEYKIDIENDGGQVVVVPSKIEGKERKWLQQGTPEKMPVALSELLLQKVTGPRKTNSELLKEDISSENFKINPDEFKLVNNNLEGSCNSSFIKLGGILRKQLSLPQTSYVLNVFNRHLLEKPMDKKSVDAMVNQLDKYIDTDESEFVHNIIEYLKITEYASKPEIEMALFGKRATGKEKILLDRTIVNLIKDEKLVRRGKDYKLIKSMEWKDTLIDLGKPVNFEVPYFDDYAYFNWGDLLLIGAVNKAGKSTLAINIVKKLVQQNIKPYYIYSESGGRFGKTALKLGLKDGDFWRVFCGRPEEIQIEKNAVVIYDWVRPTEFSKTDEMFEGLVQKLEKAQAFMVCFAQLKMSREQSGDWFAPNMATQYPSMAVKYLYEKDSDGTNTYFSIEEVRDGKAKGKKFKIPCIYDWETKEVIRQDPQSGE